MRPRSAPSSSRCARPARWRGRCWSAPPPSRWNVGEDECAGDRRLRRPRRRRSSASASWPRKPRGLRAPSRRRLARETATSSASRSSGSTRAAKANGSWRFAGDVRLPDLLFASARLAPPGGQARGLRPRCRSVEAAAVAISRRPMTGSRSPPTAGGRPSARCTRPTRASVAVAGGDDVRAAVRAKRWQKGEFETLFERGDYWSCGRGLAAVDGNLFGCAKPASRARATKRDRAHPRRRGRTVGGELRRRGWRARRGRRRRDVLPNARRRAGRAAASPTRWRRSRSISPRDAGRPVQVTLPQAHAQMHDPVSPGALFRMTALPGAGGITAALRMDVASADGMAASLARLAERTRPPHSNAARVRRRGSAYAISSMLGARRIACLVAYRIGYMRGSPGARRRSPPRASWTSWREPRGSIR